MADNQELINKVTAIHNSLNPFMDAVSGVLQRYESLAKDAEDRFEKLLAEIASLKSVVLHGNEAAPVTGPVENPPADGVVAPSSDVAAPVASGEDVPSADAPSADAPSADAPSADAPSADQPVEDVTATAKNNKG